MIVWWTLGPALRPVGFALIDLMLASAFSLMSRGRWFPVPLSFLHAALVLYYVYVLAIGAPHFWVAAFINRVFELALLYVAGCAAYRIRALNRERRRLPPPTRRILGP